MKNALKSAIAESLAKAAGVSPLSVAGMLAQPKNTEFGDIAFPCFALAKEWKVPPPECAKQLARKFSPPNGVLQAIPAGPFLNFKLERQSFVSAVVAETISAPAKKLSDRQKIILEYSSPNIAKPFHVGHLRATLIGNSLDRVYRRLGYDIVSINHVGDWGTQFGFVYAGCKLWGKPEHPTVKTLVELYKRATSLKEQQEKNQLAPEDANQPDVNEMARAFFIDLEKSESYAVEFWKWCSEISLKYLKETYVRLGVAFDHYTGESFYSDKLDAVKADLQGANLLTESEGAFGVDLGEKLGFARILTPDGRSLYLTRDIATAKYRAETFHFDRALYVVGVPQSLHFEQLKAILKVEGKDYSDKIEHVAFGHVIGMKTRGGGEIVELNDFIDEAIERALAAYREQVGKRPEGLDENKVAEAVALSAIVFSNLNRARTKDVHFSWEHALAFQGDSGPYLLYACARINGIKEKAAEAGLKPAFSPDAKIAEESAFQLAYAIDSFDDALKRTVVENEPANLASYALDLAKAFSQAYNDLKVVGEEKTLAESRLALFECARLTLSEAISLLGMKLVDRM